MFQGPIYFNREILTKNTSTIIEFNYIVKDRTFGDLYKRLKQKSSNVINSFIIVVKGIHWTSSCVDCLRSRTLTLGFVSQNQIPRKIILCVV